VLMDLLIQAKTFSDFLAETERPDSIWRRMNELDSIHEGILERELTSLETLARASLRALPVNLARMYRFSGLLPDPDFVEARFSAAIEFLRSSITQVRTGAKPRKNDRGLYVDQQLFFYLADPEAVVVTNENFSREIKTSPQRSRIISYREFRDL